MAFVIPVALTLTELLQALGLAVVSAAAIVAVTNSDLPASMRQWIADNQARVKADLEKKEPREPTPFTAPPLFTTTSINKQKVFKKKANSEIWVADNLHKDHFEVYASDKHFEKGNRNRAVYVDGRLKQMF